MAETAANTVMAVYRARDRCEEQLVGLLRRHYPTLNSLGLVANGGAILLRSPEEPVFVEIFEWKSQDAIRIAHESKEVQALWAGLGDIAANITLSDLKESGKTFAKFQYVARID
jgi:hypothetical protein